MASLQSQTEAVRAAVASVATCTPTTSATLKDLLKIGEPDSETSKPAPTSRTTKSTTKTSAAAQRARSKTNDGRDGQLPAKDKAVLATHVINTILKALAEAVKNPILAQAPQSEVPKPVPNRSALRRRSNSLPLSPLQTRSLNKTSTSTAATKSTTPPATSPTPSAGCLAAVECGRSAFACLRTLQASGSIPLPELQLETGMSSFINKLIALGLFDQAAKELRILKKRLENMATSSATKKAKTTAAESSTAPRTFSDLLDYPKINTSGPLLNLIISTQLQVLRVIHGLKKSVYLNSALPFLRQSHPSSPLKLTLLSLKDEKSDRLKIARQFENFSQTLLSLAPSISEKEDAAASDPRLNPSPETSLELQALGLSARLRSWILSDFKGDVDKHFLWPFLRCVNTFTRRTSSDPTKVFNLTSTSFSQIWELVGKLGYESSKDPKGPLAGIYQHLAATSREAGDFKTAQDWNSKTKSLMATGEESPAKCCAITAEMIALALKQSAPVEESQIKEVLDTFQGSLRGTTSELDDLLVSVSFLRKVAVAVVLSDGKGQPENIRKSLEAIILQLPRFAGRWLGNQPTSSGAAKDLLRFDHRRQHLMTYVPHILDSAIMLIKTLMEGGRMEFEQMDPVFQDCLRLLDNTRTSIQRPSASYHVKISHFYYQMHLSLRKKDSSTISTLSLRALRRSIDSIKDQSDAEQSRAQLIVKWERFAELCRVSGRKDDAANAFRSIRDHLVRQEVVLAVTEDLKAQAPLKAWGKSMETQALSRAVCGLGRLEKTLTDWTWLLAGSEPDKATALEHDLYFFVAREEWYRQEAGPSNPTISSLLSIYTMETYPVRRLRSILFTLTLFLNGHADVSELRMEAASILEKIGSTELANDKALARYIPHFQNLAKCVFTMTDGNIDPTTIGHALSDWKLMISKCQNPEDLLGHIDEPTQLLGYLQMLSDSTRVKGFEMLTTDILELAATISQLTDSITVEHQVVNNTALCLQQLSLGRSAKAEKIILSNQGHIEKLQGSEEATVRLHLTASEYHLAVGEFNLAEQHLASAYHAGPEQARGRAWRILLAQASSLSSRLALEFGNTELAVQHAKNAVKLLANDWDKFAKSANSPAEPQTEDESQAQGVGEDSTLGVSRMETHAAVEPIQTGPDFWNMAHPYFQYTMRLSLVYAHLGQFQETAFYAEQALTIARSLGLAAYIFQATSRLASIWMRACKPEKARGSAIEARSKTSVLEPTYENITMICQLSHVYRDLNEPTAEAELVEQAESMLKILSEAKPAADRSTENQLEVEMAKLSIKEATAKRAIPRPRARTTTRTTTARTTAKKAAPKKAVVPAEPRLKTDAEHTQIAFLRARVRQQQAAQLIAQKDWSSVISNLQSDSDVSKLPTDYSRERLLMAIGLIGQSLDQMGRDSVFSVIQDSSLSFPSILKEKATADRASLSPKPSFLEDLQLAQDYLLEAHSIASLNGDGALVHQISTLLQNAFTLSFTASRSKLSGAGHPAHASSSVDLARNLAWGREQKAILRDLAPARSRRPEWSAMLSPRFTDENEADSMFMADISTMQKNHVDIIPNSWHVVSVSLGDNKNDLCITRYKADETPFHIRLPLGRASSRDADNEVLSFEEGRSELHDIIEAANRTCHGARDIRSKTAKAAWWAEREELDNRMKDLLVNIEETWLGGFRGIFAPDHKRPDLFANFQQSFLKILDAHLPSRRPRGRRTKTTASKTRINLDPRIMDLFIGLGDASDPECDLDEPLNDLLYYVVDILQFHGEHNAYDEVDFDAMVVETFGALHSFHAAVKAPAGGDEAGHTILILDKALHSFPWESLPCMLESSVSRIPSLACLHRAIQDQRAPATSNTDIETASQSSAGSVHNGDRAGHHISRNAGTYILNPGQDLANTQTTFGKPLASLPPSWQNIENRAPTETEFEKALTDSDLFLYFGHGSGAQYIRSHTIKKLKCRAVALLMGCSSASLADVGDFESYGPVWSYMQAGSQAVVGTLWDVTDRDIDRFAGSMFEEWGLMARGTFPPSQYDDGNSRQSRKKGKGIIQRKKSDESMSSSSSLSSSRGGSDDDEGNDKTSLVEAVTRARHACRFRYLTAAAVCVYGIPVYLEK